MLIREPTLLPEEYQVVNIPLIFTYSEKYHNIHVEIPIPHSYEIDESTISIRFHKTTKRPIIIKIFSNSDIILEKSIRVITAHIAIQILRKLQ